MSLLTPAFLTSINGVVDVPVMLADSGSDLISSTAHAKKLRDLLVQKFPDNVWVNSTKENRVYPDCVYKVAGSTPLDNFGVITGRESVFLVSLYNEKTYEPISVLFDEVDALLKTSVGFEIVDHASDYESETNTHEIAIEVVLNTPLGFDDESGGCVIAIEGGCRSASNQMDGCLSQDKTCQYHFILQAKDKTTLKQIKGQLEAYLLGHTEGSLFTTMEHLQGQPLVSSGGLLSWVETYQNTEILSANI